MSKKRTNLRSIFYFHMQFIHINVETFKQTAFVLENLFAIKDVIMQVMIDACVPKGKQGSYLVFI